MALELPGFLQAGSYGASSFNQYLQTLIGGTGIVGSGDLQVSANGTANMSVNVAEGQVLIPGTLGVTAGFPNNPNYQNYGASLNFTSQGTYESYQDASVNLEIAAADPVNPRIDLIVASVQDAQYSGSDNQAVLQVITGTPAPSPSGPSVPASSVVLAEIAVAANATSITSGNITDERPFMVLASGGPTGGRMYASGQTVVPNGVTTQITSLAEDWAVGGVTVESNTLTVPVAGLYVVSAAVQWQSDGGAVTGGNYATIVYHNSSANYRQWWTNAATGATPTSGGSDVSRLAAGDTLKLYGYQASGVSEASAYTSYVTWLSAVLVSTTAGVA